MKNAFLIAAPQSGSGKTTVALAVMAAFSRRGLRVAPYKCGPDFIDPGYHRLVCGRASINLDSWMCPPDFVAETFALHAADADVAVIEGVMGLFDGLGATLEGSSAEVAAITGAPVVLVINARGMAASVAALVKGFCAYDPRVRLAGVIFNNVGSKAHAELLRNALASALPELAVFGCIPRDEALEIASRHLGLVTVDDHPLSPEYLQRLAALAEQHLDLDGLAGLYSSQPLRQPPPGERYGSTEESKPRIAVARDEAFCFVYEDNLRLLSEAGAEMVMFSPLKDRSLPEGCTGVYLPGGYPELHAETLAENRAMRQAIHDAGTGGMPVYAECGGLIYLTRGMEMLADGGAYDFVGLFPVRARMLPRRRALGYRQVQFRQASPISSDGVGRGHEFHYSELDEMPVQVERCYQLSRQGVELGGEGYRVGNCLASYIHLHFGSNPALAPAFVQSCRNYALSLQRP